MKLKWTFEKLKKEALKYKTRSEFQKHSCGAYCAAVRNKVLKKICRHMPKRILKPYKWTYEKLVKEVKKYKIRSEFKSNSSGAWDAADKMGILEKLYPFLEPSKIEPYVYGDVELVALQHNTRIDFQRKSPAEYHWAHRNGFLEIICSKMQKPGDVSSQEKELLGYIKKRYFSAKTLKDRSVKIPNKPHIQGFDLDIYIKNLNKAIEFDGKYWHSSAGLSRSREHWPKKDIENYHEIKDSWFASKGIQILHIKEEDWNLDKEACLKRCLEFLAN